MTVLENLEKGGYTVREPGRFRAALTGSTRSSPSSANADGRRRAHCRAASSRCSIGRALMTGPRVVVLDEPSPGLSPKFLGVIFARSGSGARGGTTFLMVEPCAPLACPTGCTSWSWVAIA